jgi:excisionase family DNA binding protein
MTSQSPPALLLTPGEAADILRVDPSTLREWVRRDKLECVTLPGGHRRYRRADIERLAGLEAAS